MNSRSQAQREADRRYKEKRNAKRRADHAARKERNIYHGDRRSNKYKRCPTCGGKVLMPCLECEIGAKKKAGAM